MQTHPFVPIKHSIATHLLKVVFAMYLILVLTLTTIHLATEYAHTKAEVLEELQSLEMTVKSGLGQALWEMNLPQTRSIMRGIVQLPIIVGVHIEDHKGNVVGQIGQVLNREGVTVIVDLAETQGSESLTARLFGHTFSLFYTRGDQEFLVGNVTMYSSSGVVFERIRFGFLLLIVNAIIQIIAFWILFLWISRTKLSRPLAELTYAAGQLDLDNLENITIRVHTSGRNELKILEETFNTMIQKLLTAREKLQELNRTLEHHRDELEQRVQERTEALHQSEAELRALFAGMTDVVLLLNREGRYLKIAPTSPDLLYKPADELNGKTLHETFPHDQANMFLAHIHQSLETQQLVNLEYRLNIGGTEFWFDGRVAPMSNDTVVFVARDMTERKQFEVQLRRAKESAESANQAKSVFLANMSHELRTPLNAVLGYAQILARSQHLSLDEQQHLSTIMYSGEHLLALINDVLEFSKIDADRVELQPVSFDLCQMLSDLEDMFRLRAERKGLTLKFAHASDVPSSILTDQRKLRQILINLLDNAVKYTEKGKVTFEVTKVTKVTEVAEVAHIEEPTRQPSLVTLQFSISDTGIGVAPADVEKIFDAFTRVDEQQYNTGTGLGLPITRKYVRMMGGEIAVKSTVGNGSTFFFDLPVDVADQSSVISHHATLWQRVVGLKPEQSAYRLLIVEDEEYHRNLLVHILKPMGFQVREAHHGEEALALWHTWQPHLIWMDMRMPVMDGYEATRKIRKAERRKQEAGGRRQNVEEQKSKQAEGHKSQGHASISNPQTRNTKHQTRTSIIALTAHAFEENRTDVLEAGCDDFVRKPFREAEIFEMLHKHLDVHFIYEEHTQSPVTNYQSSIKDVLTPEALAALPDAWLADLKQGAEVADVDLLSSVIEQIHERDAALADTLTQLTNDFEYDEILALVQNSV